MLDHLLEEDDEAVYTASDQAMQATGDAYKFLRRQRSEKLDAEVVQQIQRLMHAIDELLEGEMR